MVLLAYYVVPIKLKNIILIVSGILFYAWGEPFYVSLLLIIIVVDYMAGRAMEKFEHNQRARLWVLISSILFNLSFLVVFKYGSFIITNINGMLGVNLFDADLALPIGMSFYMLQSLSYSMDVYRGSVPAEKNFICFASGSLLFPKLIAGPIVRYAQLGPQMRTRVIDYNMVADGISLFVRGLGKKVLLADVMGRIWIPIKAVEYTTLPVMTAWIGIIAFSFQIYYGFSGYCDMGIGLGKMLGFNLPKNFDSPYQAHNVREFFNRWNMTVDSWFKDYVYNPMGGSRNGVIRTICNLVIVWCMIGLWYGASWNFLVWGLYFGLVIVLEKFVLSSYLLELPQYLQRLYTFFLIVFGWVIFEMSTLAEIPAYFGAMFGLNGAGLYEQGSIYLIMSNFLVFGICILGVTITLRKWLNRITNTYPLVLKSLKLVSGIIIFAISLCYLADAGTSPFDGLRF